MDVETFIKSDMCVDLDVYTQSRLELVPGHRHPDTQYRTINKTWGLQDAIQVVTDSVRRTILVYGGMPDMCTCQVSSPVPSTDQII